MTHVHVRWMRRVLALCACSLVAAAGAPSALAQEITVVNPGGEDYDTSGGNVAIPQSPIPPDDGTGWNATTDQVPSDYGVEAIPNNPRSGTNRLAFGAVVDGTFATEDVIVFQQTDHIVSAGEEFILSFFGRGFFQYEADFDDQMSFFGYLDGADTPVPVDMKAHNNIVGGAWNPAGHSFIVPNGSPLIGGNLTIGFFTQSLNGGGFSAVDDVSLMLGEGNPPADADGDGDVDMDDVQLVADNFLATVPVGTMGDLDDNTVVDFADFRIWKDASGFSGSLADILGAGVPEPTAAGLTAAALSVVLGRSRRSRRWA